VITAIELTELGLQAGGAILAFVILLWIRKILLG